MSTLRSDYLYDLPEELIAQEPAQRRDASRLMLLDRASGELNHQHFRDVPELLSPGDLLVLNDTRVIPARLRGKRPTGGDIELLLLEPAGEGRWITLAKPAKRLREGERVLLPEGREAIVEAVGEEGRRTVRFEPLEEWDAWLWRNGSMPLPPYIQREVEASDRERYQTVYAEHKGAVAAPTAGLHFTDELLGELESKGIGNARLTLHVGIGTFRPVSVEDVRDHRMDAERYIVNKETAQKINDTKKNGGRIVAVGTTAVRTLESISDEEGMVHPGSDATDIFIRPPYRFKTIDALITNFHLPGSTLIMLVSALAGRETILRAYKEAVRERYRFFSYGDAMLIL